MNQTLQGYRTLLARHPRNPILAHAAYLRAAGVRLSPWAAL